MPAHQLHLKTKRRVKRLQVSAKSESRCHYPLRSFIHIHIACNLFVIRSVLEVEQNGSLRWADGMATMVTRRVATPRSKMLRWWVRMASMNALFLLVLLTGCRSTQDGYLDQAIDHATAVELEQALGRPSHEQVLQTGQRLWLYRREGSGTGSRDFTPFCQDLWLTLDRNGVLRMWKNQRC
jgi:hypothetical protein